MGKKRSSATREQQSIIPTIKTEERRFEELLAQARAQAAEIVAAAQAEAARRIAEAEAEVPALIERERAAQAASGEDAAREERARSARELESLEKAATARMDEAVAHIVRRVWPLDRP